MEAPATDVAWVGIDLGTQSVRAAIVDDHGSVLSLGSAPLASRRRTVEGSRQHEQDPHQWWDAVGEASRSAFAALSSDVVPGHIGGVAICSTSGTVLLTDERGAPLTPALMYDDARAGDELARIHALSDVVPQSADVQLSWALPKLGWLMRHRAGTGAGNRAAPPGRWVAHSADVIAANLVGHRTHTDTSHALKSGYDVVKGGWNHALADAAGVDLAVLPEVVRPGTTLGTVTAHAATHTGIPAGTPVVAGMTDGCAAQIAAGSLAPGTWNSVLGTTLVLKGVSSELIADPDGAVYSHLHPDGGWLPGGASNVGAGVITEEFGTHDLDRLSDAASRFEPAGAVIYPLSARGERFPFVRPDATGFQLGDVSAPEEKYAAMIQGVAFVERLCFEHLAAIGADVSGHISVTGGATRSAYWNQLRADVLGRPLVLPESPEPSFGMAVLASSREESVTARAGRMVTTKAIVEPRPHAHERFSAGYATLAAELVRRGYINESFTVDLSRSTS
ncbi:carbohydrate kinase [Phytoactinopolyspora alkaliphila]|uniref:Carbohydrate kinase n=1 Tax=Phytoactinopolyspora alkaliphila TaxID=1783498 RepID=A0A6N9YSI5_9ACTN|nr:FGGY family carbohydrate kinase [Phytoactinopolyspora alkaliphila]NED98003.1 carbohydrate kinase [Phytoactinopolyspora alkaliphila]